MNFKRKLSYQKDNYYLDKAMYKNYNYIFHVFRYTFAIFILAALHMLSVFILVRFGSVRTRTFGDMCREMDNSIYFGRVENKKCLDLRCFYIKYPGAISNKYLHDLLKSDFIFLPHFLISPIIYYAKKFKVFNKHLLPYMCGRTKLLRPAFRQPSKLELQDKFQFNGLKTYIPDYENKANKLLESMNLVNEEIVGIHIRDSEYQNHNLKVLSTLFNKQEFLNNIERFEDNSTLRNSSLLNFISSVKYLEKKNIKCLRFGNPSKFYPANLISPLIDYGNGGKSTHQNDVILMGKLKYLICSNSGMVQLANWMRVPIFLVDIAEIFGLETIYATIYSTPIILPKVIRWKKNDNLLTLEEIKLLDIFKLPAEQARKYIKRPESEIYMQENLPDTILNTVALGDKYLTSVALEKDVIAGKRFYQLLFDCDSYNLAPILSPFWPNLNYID